MSLADNYLGKVPDHLWKRMTGVKTVDLGRTKITELTESNFKVREKVKGAFSNMKEIS